MLLFRIFEGHSLHPFKQLIDKLEQNPASANEFILEYGSFSWAFKPKAMVEFFTDPTKADPIH